MEKINDEGTGEEDDSGSDFVYEPINVRKKKFMNQLVNSFLNEENEQGKEKKRKKDDDEISENIGKREKYREPLKIDKIK
ncbi:RNA helicase, putative [Plasmodium ovale curtisi]|uniref:RNA helicase, putative n=1 Tax=Plasmodium ovale curtisi TaxID=864141 RepID=A0A1A8WR71_PLAOA|nr:RNA helicase, putative [Plasmodium ovale curtisi]